MAAVALTGLRQHLGYLKPSDIGRIEEAYQFSDAAHQGQFRLSGDPYISHPLAVAEIVADWQLDTQAVMAALLHDVMEDTAISKQQITERLGKRVGGAGGGPPKPHPRGVPVAGGGGGGNLPKSAPPNGARCAGPPEKPPGPFPQRGPPWASFWGSFPAWASACDWNSMRSSL